MFRLKISSKDERFEEGYDFSYRLPVDQLKAVIISSFHIFQTNIKNIIRYYRSFDLMYHRILRTDIKTNLFQ